MLSLLGAAGVAVAFGGAVMLTVRGVRAARSDVADLTGPTRLIIVGSLVAMAAMQIALASDDFSIAYLANNHATTTPFPFDMATAWAALEGSILLWGLVLAGFTWLVLRNYRRTPDPLGAGALAVMGIVATFFFGLMLTVANPFEVCVRAAIERGCLETSMWPFAAVDAPLEGRGPNALLQNHLFMAIHPPMLYLGYVGLTVPFAYAVSALALGVPGPDWLRRSHRSTLLAWSFLTAGIVLGAWWAYEVIGWGGYWQWDPVENASFMPWLVATAFVHSALVQQRRGMLQAWNFILVIGAFALTILGTFITRSGTIASVHSFTQSAIGPALLGFLVLILVGSFVLFAQRSHLVASAPRIDNLVSREGSFLANNLLLTVYAFVVLIGTIYPILLEAFTGTRVGVGPPFFNRMAGPLSFALLLVMGFGPVTPWAQAPPGLIWRRTRGPALTALAAGILTSLLVTRVGWVVLAATLGAFVTACIFGLLFEQAARRSSGAGLGAWAAMSSVVRGDQGFWAGQLSHVGVVLVAVGIAFAANLGDHLEATLEPGDRVTFSGHDIEYKAPFQREAPGRSTVGARLEVTLDRGGVVTLEPVHTRFGADTFVVGTPAIASRPSGDLYVTLLEIGPGSATLTFDTAPLIWLLWAGGLVTAAGGFWSVAVRATERRARLRRQTADV